MALLHAHSLVADTNFLSSGREDMDVRMLGDGRPFVLELKDPAVDAVPGTVCSQVALPF